MNDRFRFRVWDKVNKEYCDRNFFITPNGELGFLINDSSPHWRIFQNTDWCIIEQCTGLKDKNGKLIYEGDIIQCIDTKLIVYFNPKIASFVFVRDVDIELCRDLEIAIMMRNAISTDGAKFISRYEIIGNIHEMEKMEGEDEQ